MQNKSFYPPKTAGRYFAGELHQQGIRTIIVVLSAYASARLIFETRLWRGHLISKHHHGVLCLLTAGLKYCALKMGEE